MTWVATAIIGGSIITGLIGADASQSAAQTQAGAAGKASDTQLAMFNQTQANVAPWLDVGKMALANQITGVQPGGQFYQNYQPSGIRPDDYTPSGITPTAYKGYGSAPAAYQDFTMEKFHSDPGYQFQLQQGQNAIENQMSKTGGANSNNMKGMLAFSQGLASTDYQKALQNYITQFQTGNQAQQQGFGQYTTEFGLGNQAKQQTLQDYMAEFTMGNQTKQQQLQDYVTEYGLGATAKQQNFSNYSGMSAGGMGAGLQQGQISANVGQSVGGNIIGAGNALAAGQVGVANALTGAGATGYNQFLQQQYLQRLGQGGGGADGTQWMEMSQPQAGYMPG